MWHLGSICRLIQQTLFIPHSSEFRYISTLQLSWEGRDIATLGDGTFCTFEVYTGLVIWDGEYHEIYINESETIPLIGMRLLRTYDLHIQTIESGLVTIKKLSI